MICDVCDVKIPSFNPETLRPYNAAVKAHNRSKRHQRCLRLGGTPSELAERERKMLEDKRERERARVRALEDFPSRLLALALGIVATRVRSAYGDFESARRAWTVEAQVKLLTLDDAKFEMDLLQSASAVWSRRRITDILNGSDYELLRLLSAHLRRPEIKCVI
jgi:hypothetical protein